MHRDSDGNALHAPVLVLNASYEPINVCAARRALVLVLSRTRAGPCRGRIYCCAIVIPASIALPCCPPAS